jgi:carboxymethylenebutenolidase
VGEMIRLAGPDGFEFTAYHARPTDARRGGLVLIQEIFGVTERDQGACRRVRRRRL